MADIATLFHWPPAAMAPMSLAELMGWREAARRRSQPEDDTR